MIHSRRVGSFPQEVEVNILVIGGTFYFGKHIVRLLLQRGDRVTLFTRGTSRPEFWDEVDHILGDRNDRDDFAAKLKGRPFDAVIDQIAYRKQDVEPILRALHGNLGRYVLTSTISVYGGPYHALSYRKPQRAGGVEWEDACINFTKHTPIREEGLDLSSCGDGNDALVHEYGEGKRQCECILLEAGIDHISIRVPPVMGPEAPYDRLWWYIQRIRDGQEIILFDGGQNIFRNIYSVDAARAIVNAMTSDRTEPGPYNIGQGEIMTLRRFLESMAQAMCRPLNVVPIPAEHLLKEGSLPWEDWRFDPFSRPESYVMDIFRARRDFDMKWTPQEDWLAETLQWYESYKGDDSFNYAHRGREVALARDYQEWVSSYQPAS
jgi:nucleoside-diphosphate-sugar epimerase